VALCKHRTYITTAKFKDDVTFHSPVVIHFICKIYSQCLQYSHNITRVCFYHLRHLRQICRRASYDVTVRLVLALIISPLDYCNATLASLPVSTIEPLQRVQNAAVHLIFQLGPKDHVTQGLHQLHWLLISYSPTYNNNIICS